VEELPAERGIAVVHVTIDEHGSTLTGPAVFTARGELGPSWWASAGSPTTPWLR
jgi:hypothetical protein